MGVTDMWHTVCLLTELVMIRVVLAILFFQCYMCLNMSQPPYFHSFNSGFFYVYQYTHYLVEPGAQEVETEKNETVSTEKILFDINR